ncbi:MAG: shikimate dehydrogenase [Pseudonocardiaceae bacterium]
MSLRRAAVLGRPVAHSLSPVLHRAAYTALGLAGWHYDAIECGDSELPWLVAGLGAEWVGLSVTMPGKVAALQVAVSATERATVVGAANTLVRAEGGWVADSTDVDGVVGALRATGFAAPATGLAVLLGAGGTARAALAGLAELGMVEVVLVVRDAGRAAATVRCGQRLGLSVPVRVWGEGGLAGLCAGADVVLSTVPAAASEPVAAAVAAAPVVLDAGYHPWPTPIASAAGASGSRLASGLDMLLHQAFGQVEQFTGRPAPQQAMRDALQVATGHSLAV